MTTQARIEAEDHALRAYPRESCGFIVRTVEGQDIYVPARNAALTPSEHFVIPPEEFSRAINMGEVVQLVHSHPNVAAVPSQGDRVSCEESGFEWLILSVGKGDDDKPYIAGDCVFRPSGYEAPLIGREFVFGVLDCYTLIRDWFAREQGVILKDFERRDNFWKEGPDKVDLYAQYEQAGFKRVIDGEELQVGDCMLMQLRSTFPNHAAVYIGGGYILHHLYGQLSKRDLYGFAWKEKTRFIVRYQG